MSPLQWPTSKAHTKEPGAFTMVATLPFLTARRLLLPLLLLVLLQVGGRTQPGSLTTLTLASVTSPAAAS